MTSHIFFTSLSTEFNLKFKTYKKAVKIKNIRDEFH